MTHINRRLASTRNCWQSTVGRSTGQDRRESLKKFPPFEAWLPKGRALSGEEKQLLAGPKSLPTSLSEYVAQELGSRPHTFKSSRSRVCQLNPPTRKFGIVDNMFVHKFAGCEYVWLLIGWYPLPKLQVESSLWFSEKQIESRSPVLIQHVSCPLVIPLEENFVWFLDAPKCFNQH